MKSIKIPFQFEGGRVGTVTSPEAIARQKIIDVLTTMRFERVMRHTYGTNTYDLVFDMVDNLDFADFKVDAIQTMNEVLSRIEIIDLQLLQGTNQVSIPNSETTILINVVYRLPLGAPQLVQVNIVAPGSVTEDYPI